jgi:hypothetical protein
MPAISNIGKVSYERIINIAKLVQLFDWWPSGAAYASAAAGGRASMARRFLVVQRRQSQSGGMGEGVHTRLTCGVDADGVLRQLGQAGRFHLKVYVLVALAAVQVGMLHTTYIFLAADVPYRSVRATSGWSQGSNVTDIFLYEKNSIFQREIIFRVL